MTRLFPFHSSLRFNAQLKDLLLQYADVSVKDGFEVGIYIQLWLAAHKRFDFSRSTACRKQRIE